jgi:hypothetical protein
LLAASCPTAPIKIKERDWQWTSISAIFGFTFWTRVLAPDIYRAQWSKPTSLIAELYHRFFGVKLLCTIVMTNIQSCDLSMEQSIYSVNNPGGACKWFFITFSRVSRRSAN